MWLGLTGLGFLSDWVLVLALVLVMYKYLQIIRKLLSFLFHSFFFYDVPGKSPDIIYMILTYLERETD